MKFPTTLLIIALFTGIGLSAQKNARIKYEETLELTGDILQIAIPASGFAISILKKDWQGTKQHSLSIGTNFLITHSLKTIIKKSRPEGYDEFNAFPSGHTSAAFQGAAFIQRRYGWKYGQYAYFLAAVVGFTRIEGLNTQHDIWDVLGGAAIGIGSSLIFTRPYEKNGIDIGFSATGAYKVISFRYQF